MYLVGDVQNMVQKCWSVRVSCYAKPLHGCKLGIQVEANLRKDVGAQIQDI